MKIALKGFQTEAVDELVGELDSARYEAGRGKLQAVSLASATGSGKTAIATAIIERVLEGDGEHQADPDAIFLWITDQPELNEQTRNKMLGTSTVLGPGQLIVIDAKVNQETLNRGRVYFLNTQKLGRNSSLLKVGNSREHTLWQTLANTLSRYPTSFYVIIDEAHRGMQEGAAREEANTIIQKFIKGSDELPAVPLIFAISATIERFDVVVAKTPRVKRQWEVPIEDVVKSGLIKDAINLFHPDGKQPSDMTLLRDAARALKDYRLRWKQYAKAGGETPVSPVLVVQVQDGVGKQISRTDLGAAISALTEELGPLPNRAFAHSFQEGAPITVGTTDLRYLAPSAIDADPDVQVVFFKTSLNTGWDCPRAEVMMSFRSSSEDVAIAQLVGRMVRAPLARRIESDEHLNTVALYLPHYDRKSLKRVIARLEADPNNLPPVAVRDGKTVVTIDRVKGSTTAFARLSGLPTYIIPKAKTSNQVRRLGKLASLLVRTGIDDEAPEEITELLIERLLSEHASRKGSQAFKRVVKDSGVIEVRMVEWRYDPQGSSEATVELPVSPENVSDLFEWAGRRFNEGLHKAYWKARVAQGAHDHKRTKLEAYALATNSAVVDSLEKAAQRQVQTLLKKHADAIGKLPDGTKQAFGEIRELGLDPELTSPRYPKRLEMAEADDAFQRHLYQDEKGSFSFKATSWERATLDEELSRDDLVGWMRNPDRKAYSICVPYEMAGTYKGCYPDFLVVRKEGRRLMVDIVDPHLLSYEDAWHRAKGLAKYADKHADKFGRIEMIRLKDGNVDRLDLVDESQRQRVLKVSSNDHLRELFDNK